MPQWAAESFATHPDVPPVLVRPARASDASPFREIANGISYVRDRPALLVLILIGYAIELTAFPYIVDVPSVVDEVFDGGSVALGFMTSGIAIGAIVASAGATGIAGGRHAWRAHWMLTLLFCIALMAYAVAPTFLVAVVIGVAMGVGETGCFTLNQALAMRYTEPGYCGRVQAVLLLGFGLFGLAAFPLGLMADAIGIRQTLFIEGLAGLVLVAGLLVYASRIGAAADARGYVASSVPAEEREQARG